MPGAKRRSAAPVIGMMAVQGDFREHLDTLASIGALTREVRLPEDLEGVSGLILPGGESTAMRKLYDFASHTFTPCGKTGSSGPAQSTCQSNYTTSWDNDSTLFTVTGGIQYWQVPVTGTYEIAAAGAAGIRGLRLGPG